MATLIKTDGTKTWVIPDNGQVFTLEQLQVYVGGYIEVIRIPTEIHPDYVMIVNEEGLIVGLEHNPVATQIAGQFIVGPAITLPGGML